MARVHNTTAVNPKNNYNNNKGNESNNRMAMHTNEHNEFAGFDALLRALYAIEKRLSDENENDINNNNNKNARKRSSKPSRRLFSLRS